MQHTEFDKLHGALALSFKKAEPDLTLRQVGILLDVVKNKRVEIKDIAKNLNIPKAAVSRGVDRLEGLGLCGREKVEDDLRRTIAFPRQSAYMFLNKWMERLS